MFRKPGFGKHHTLSTSRQAALLDLCEAMGWLRPEDMREAPLADRATLARFHDADYIDAFEQVAATMSAPPRIRTRYKLGTMENPIFEGMAERAKASVGGAILAAELALDGKLAFHPGGGTHHGRPDRASGFCYFNDPVFAIQRFLDAGLRRVLYVDLDAHHVDGVQEAFAAAWLDMWGEWGSSSVSECWWWRRCSAHQRITGPWTAMEPAAAKM